MERGLSHYFDQEDIEILDEILIEVANRVRDLYAHTRRPLNTYNDITVRADCFRLIRAAVELSPSLPES